MLVTGRFDDARKVLLKFSSYSKQGLIPDYIEKILEYQRTILVMPLYGMLTLSGNI
jgi:glycogen debranching enzyme